MTIPPFTAFDGKLMVCYGQAYVLSPECEMLMPEDAFAGQRNGLCGAAVSGSLFLVTGLHTGYVNLQVQVHHAAPPVDESWEEIVEVSWSLNAGPAVLQDWNAEALCEIPLERGAYRVRYAARRFGEAEPADDEEESDEAAIESYSLSFWPALRMDDAVLKQTSPHAAYWNDSGWPTMQG
jgi:hypothetical protein